MVLRNLPGWKGVEYQELAFPGTRHHQKIYYGVVRQATSSAEGVYAAALRRRRLFVEASASIGDAEASASPR